MDLRKISLAATLMLFSGLAVSDELSNDPNILIKSESMMVTSRERIDFDYIKCDPGKAVNATCSGSHPIEADAGWQACRLLAQEYFKSSRAGWSSRKDRIVPNDTQQPPRFRAYQIDLWAQYGNDNVTQKIVLKRVGIKMIPFEATKDERAREGCDL